MAKKTQKVEVEQTPEQIVKELSDRLWFLYEENLRMKNFSECRAVLHEIFIVSVGRAPSTKKENEALKVSIFDKANTLKAIK